jgi:Stress responsive A/B Barrel Domain
MERPANVSSTEKETIVLGQHSVHFAVYRWNPGAPVEDIERGFTEICSMGDQIPGIQVASWGRNESPHAYGYTHAMTIVGDTMEAVRAFRELARVQPIAAVMSAHEEAGIGADYHYPEAKGSGDQAGAE